MALQAVPGYIGQAAYEHPVELFRNLTKALTGAGTGLLASTTGFAMTPSASLMQLTVAGGYAVIVGQEDDTQGSYFVWSDEPETLAWPAHGGSDRMDTLLLRVIDTQYGTDSDTPQAEWEIITGTSGTAIADVEFQVGGDFYRPGAWWRVADVLVQPADTNMAATTIADYRKLASTDDQRANTGAYYLQTVKYTASSTFTKANYPNLKKVRVRVQAGGGGSGGAPAPGAGNVSCGGGGQGGGYAESWINAASLGSSETVTVGAGGTAATSTGGAVAGTGGTSSFGSLVSATGGAGGTTGLLGSTAFTTDSGNGAQTLTGDVVSKGQGGGMGSRLGSAAGQTLGGMGGSSFMGGGGAPGRNALGEVGGLYGGGAGGSTNDPSAGAKVGLAGGAGIVLVDVYV